MDAIVSNKKIAFNGMSLGMALRAQKSPENFFGRKIVSEGTLKFRHKAEMLMSDFFNGQENNFGFTRPVRLN